ncbi:MAG: hypothetical protein LBD20_02160 [Spirochaetaceae bacterium]|jgi:hypothetical protein|nr:hypothetical protein [Spirochaetaceae bacterium]
MRRLFFAAACRRAFVVLAFLVTANVALGQNTMPELPQTINALVMPSARAAATGGYHAAFGEGFDAFFSNPAIFAAIEPQKSFTEFSYAVNDFDIFSIFVSSDEEMKEKLFDRLEEGIVLKMDLGGPIAFGAIQEKWGWGVFNVTRMHLEWVREVVWKIHFRLSEELFFISGFGFRLLDTGVVIGDIGFTAKAFFRAGYLPKMFLTAIKKFWEDMSRDVFENQLGIGEDIGARFTFYDIFSVGVTLHDPFSPAYVAEYRNVDQFYKQNMVESGMVTVTPRLAAGLALHFKSVSIVVSDLVITVDYNQMLPFLEVFPRNPLLEFSAGLEIQFLDVLSLRAGFSELLPCGGIGLDLTLIKFDAAFMMKELGNDPGDFSTWAANLSILYRY